MLIQELERWKCETGQFGCELDEEYVTMFLEEKKGTYDWRKMAAYLALQLFELQVCMEGLIEDVEYLNGQENQKTQKENRQGYGCSCQRRCP